jgi:hypothetical protein
MEHAPIPYSRGEAMLDIELKDRIDRAEWVTVHQGTRARHISARRQRLIAQRAPYAPPERKPLYLKARKEETPGDYKARAAFKACIVPVLQRDKRRCVYCGDAAAHIDQYTDGAPSMDTLVACCLTCRTIGKQRSFDTIDEKRVWLDEQRAAWSDHD